MQNDQELPTRQAAAIYLKNFIVNNWSDKEGDGSGAPLAFSIHEQDRAMVRDGIVEAVISTPGNIRLVDRSELRHRSKILIRLSIIADLN